MGGRNIQATHRERVCGDMGHLGSSFRATRSRDCAFSKGRSRGYFRNIMLPVVEKFSLQSLASFVSVSKHV